MYVNSNVCSRRPSFPSLPCPALPSYLPLLPLPCSSFQVDGAVTFVFIHPQSPQLPQLPDHSPRDSSHGGRAGEGPAGEGGDGGGGDGGGKGGTGAEVWGALDCRMCGIRCSGEAQAVQHAKGRTHRRRRQAEELEQKWRAFICGRGGE